MHLHFLREVAHRVARHLLYVLSGCVIVLLHPIEAVCICGDDSLELFWEVFVRRIGFYMLFQVDTVGFALGFELLLHFLHAVGEVFGFGGFGRDAHVVEDLRIAVD